MTRVEDRLHVEPDGTIVARSGKVELGQGIRRAFARMVAGELHVPTGRVRVELGDTATAPWDMGTFGSRSIATEGVTLARAAAVLRGLLIERAARRWDLPAATLAVTDGFVTSPDGHRASYVELVAGDPPQGDVPETTPLSPQRPDTRVPDDRRSLVKGEQKFVADLRVPGMLRGRVVHAPAHGSHVEHSDDAAARAKPGVVAVVHDGDFVGIAAEHARDAQLAEEALSLQWTAPDALAGTEHVLSMREDPGVAEAFARARHTIDAEYALPHIANAPLGTSTALADVRGEIATVTATTQSPFRVQAEVAEVLGWPAERVRVIAGRASGSFGRNNRCEAAVEAARLSRATGRPVLVEWTRADELATAACRPMLRAHIRAGCDAAGSLLAWSSDIITNPHADGDLAITSARNAVPPYRIGAAHVEVRVVPAEIPTAALRSLSAAPNVFASESAIDELALVAGYDPLEMRLRNTQDPRLVRVLEKVAERARWGSRPLGIACAIYQGTYIAEVAEVAVEGSRVRVTDAWCAVDCGTLVDGEGARGQLEGAVVQATSWALFEELHHSGARVLDRGFHDYPVARISDAPFVDIVFTDDGATTPTGLGEPGVVPFGAAIANALAALTGRRVRTQPVR